MLKQSSSRMKKVIAILLAVLFVTSLTAVTAIAGHHGGGHHGGHWGHGGQWGHGGWGGYGGYGGWGEAGGGLPICAPTPVHVEPLLKYADQLVNVPATTTVKKVVEVPVC